MGTYRRLSGFFVFIIIFAIHSIHLPARAEGFRSEPRNNNFIIKDPAGEENFTKMSEHSRRGVASEPSSVGEAADDKKNQEAARDGTSVEKLAEKPVEKPLEMPAEKKEKRELFYKCTKAREVRWIRVYYQKNGRCRTVYSKTGNAQEVSTAYNYASCEAVLKNIKENLEKGDFKCEEKILMGALELE